METTSPAIENLLQTLPDPEGARRFFLQFAEKHRLAAAKLSKNESLLSDVLTLAAFSPLLATTLAQNPEYVNWLARRRESSNVVSKEEMFESLARFSLTNSQTETQILLARFRRRELLRIYLRDVRRLETIAEITEELSNLADAILEYALRYARQELDNRYGTPLETDDKGRARIADFSVVALGKLGSRELNYSSDIDLLFLYSADGTTSGSGARGAVTNREYFIKLAELVSKTVGGQSSEAAYRVDLRLRPHGRIGALAVSLDEAVKYYRTAARAWERQVLIRARCAAGEVSVFKDFIGRVAENVFSKDATVAESLESVRLSKEKINREHLSGSGFNAKLGHGGIREIEFIAQALQLAYGGRDRWLRAPHTLVSLARLADRQLISETELTGLFDAYNFLRRLEHRLQMEHGLQTHIVPADDEKRLAAARRMNFASLADFDSALELRTQNVSRVFKRVFGKNEIGKISPPECLLNALPSEAVKAGEVNSAPAKETDAEHSEAAGRRSETTLRGVIGSLEKSASGKKITLKKLRSLRRFAEVSPYFAEMLAANPALVEHLPVPGDEFPAPDYKKLFFAELESQSDFAADLAALRRLWSRSILQIAAADAFAEIDMRRAKNLQTRLAEASVEAALFITERELRRRITAKRAPAADFELRLGVLGLGKLGGRGMDYGSDLDLILVYDEEAALPSDARRAEFYSRASEIFVTAISSYTRDGNLYRVDLRLRPDGKNGANVSGKTAFLEYLEHRAAIWEWLAYVKLRGVAGLVDSAASLEENARRIVHEQARRARPEDLQAETRRVRNLLEKQKRRAAGDIDIKYGAGGMLDVYFAMRFLQLRDRIPDEQENRSTPFMLEKLREREALNEANFKAFAEGYGFLAELDHHLRLVGGRSTRVPLADRETVETLARRLRVSAPAELLEKIRCHREQIRRAFENVVG